METYDNYLGVLSVMYNKMYDIFAIDQGYKIVRFNNYHDVKCQ